jgi:hypothetical protein
MIIYRDMGLDREKISDSAEDSSSEDSIGGK